MEAYLENKGRYVHIACAGDVIPSSYQFQEANPYLSLCPASYIESGVKVKWSDGVTPEASITPAKLVV